MLFVGALLALLVQEPVAAPATKRDVAIQSFDGTSLSATYYDPGRPGPGAVVFHNCDGDRRKLDVFARHLSARGIHVVTWDYRSGQAVHRTWRDSRNGDADAVHKWLVSQPGVDRERMVGIGGSCGVALALDFAERHAPQVRGVVILSGPSDSGQRAFVARTATLAVFGGASRAEGAAVPYIDSVVKASSNPASRMIAPADGGHGTDMLTRSADFESTVLDWIIGRLAATAALPDRPDAKALAVLRLLPSP